MDNKITPGPPGKRNATMRDVARLAGVSHQTVSRVLNGEPKVRAETHDRVRKAVEQLDYKRNTAARALVTSRSMILGVVTLGISQYGPTRALLGIAEAARENGYTTSLISLKDTDSKSVQSCIKQLVEESVDGVIVIAPVEGAASAATAISEVIPMIRFEPGLDNGTTCISVDEVLGARLATRHLLGLGHETVWHVAGPPGWLGTSARVQGWRDELTAAGAVAKEMLVGDWSARSGYMAGQMLTERPDATAIFVANDQMALGVLKALSDRNVRVPEDVSVVGFDDIPEAEFFDPALTTVRLDFAEVGHRCVKRLLALIDGTILQPEGPIPPELQIRGSARAPRIHIDNQDTVMTERSRG